MFQDLQHFINFERATAATFFSSLSPFQTCNSSNLLLFNASLISNVQQQQPSTFQRFIDSDFERATAATFYFPLRQFQTCYSSHLLLSNVSSISNVQQQQPSTFQCFLNKP
eukprot:1371256-Rhodomonas_salina.1